MHQQDHLLSWQLRPYIPSSCGRECGQRSSKALNGYRSLNMANGLGQIHNSSCRDCLSQSEAFLPLSLGCSTIKPGA